MLIKRMRKSLNRRKEKRKMGAISSYFADPFDVSSPDLQNSEAEIEAAVKEAKAKEENLTPEEKEQIANKRLDYFQNRSEKKSNMVKPIKERISWRKVDPDDVVRDWCN
jgi:hypothetical protein